MYHTGEFVWIINKSIFGRFQVCTEIPTFSLANLQVFSLLASWRDVKVQTKYHKKSSHVRYFLVIDFGSSGGFLLVFCCFCAVMACWEDWIASPNLNSWFRNIGNFLSIFQVNSNMIFFFFGPLSPATFQNPSIPSFLFSIISASSPFPLLAKFLIEFLQSWHAKVFLEGYFKCFTLWCETLTFFMFLSCIILEKQIQDAGTGGLCQISPVNIFREMRKLAVLKPSAQLQSGPSLILSHHPVLSALCYYSSFCRPNLESI